MKTGIVNIKFVVYFVCLSLFISIMAGIIGGVPFFTLLVRLFFGAIFFAILGAGVAFILEKFIPEVFNIENTEDEEKTLDENIDTAGQEINIVMEEENPHIADKIADDKIADDKIADDELADDEIVDDDSTGFNENDNKQEILMETAEDLEEADEVEKIDAGKAESTDNEDENHDLKEESEKAQELSNETEEILSINDNLGLDELPNIDNISDSSSSMNNYSGSSEVSSNKNYSKLGGDNDPKTAAKAIKTWLNKDKEG